MKLIRNASDLRALKEAATLAGRVIDELLAAAQPGVDTMALEEQARETLRQNRSSAPFRVFDEFGHAICVSINDEIVNGPPSRVRTLVAGDVVSIAVGTEIRGMHGKVARTACVGEASAEVARLINGTRAVFDTVLAQCKPGMMIGEMLALIPQTAEQHDLRLIENTGGAAIGKKLHENPYLPNYPDKLIEDAPMQVGFAFTLMPMMTLGPSTSWVMHDDGWTYMTQDGSLAAHFAETLLMSDSSLVCLSTPLA
jgi:methionyl aminopeptidase